MIIDIKVDLSECYAEDFDYDSELGASPSSSLSQEVVSVIRCEVKSAIQKAIGSEVRLLAEKAYKEFGEQKIRSIVDFKMGEFLDNGKVKKDHYSQEEVSVGEKLRSIFDDSNNWNSPYKKMEELGKKFAEECRKRYDLSFASSIVTGLEKQGLLKPGVFESLTCDNNKGV